MTVDRKLPRYCGQLKDLKMESDGSFFRVTFKSNDRFDGTGFFASYQFTPVADAVTITRRRSSSPSAHSSCKQSDNWTESVAGSPHSWLAFRSCRMSRRVLSPCPPGLLGSARKREAIGNSEPKFLAIQSQLDCIVCRAAKSRSAAGVRREQCLLG